MILPRGWKPHISTLGRATGRASPFLGIMTTFAISFPGPSTAKGWFVMTINRMLRAQEINMRAGDSRAWNC
jgi:hypothetical protein